MKQNIMGTKIKITEEQLKTIMERRHTYLGDANEEVDMDSETLETEMEEEVEEVEETEETLESSEINESLLKIKSEFKRFL
jgi:hypothetical protein